jgi:hypothetical protein
MVRDSHSSMQWIFDLWTRVEQCLATARWLGELGFCMRIRNSPWRSPATCCDAASHSLSFFLITTIDPLMPSFILPLLLGRHPIPIVVGVGSSKSVLSNLIFGMIPNQMEPRKPFCPRLFPQDPRIRVHPMDVPRIERLHALFMFAEPIVEESAQCAAPAVAAVSFEGRISTWFPVCTVPHALCFEGRRIWADCEGYEAHFAEEVDLLDCK